MGKRKKKERRRENEVDVVLVRTLPSVTASGSRARPNQCPRRPGRAKPDWEPDGDSFWAASSWSLRHFDLHEMDIRWRLWWWRWWSGGYEDRVRWIEAGGISLFTVYRLQNGLCTVVTGDCNTQCTRSSRQRPHSGERSQKALYTSRDPTCLQFRPGY